jgi:hypothetical protein
LAEGKRWGLGSLIGIHIAVLTIANAGIDPPMARWGCNIANADLARAITTTLALLLKRSSSPSVVSRVGKCETPDKFPAHFCADETHNLQFFHKRCPNTTR